MTPVIRRMRYKIIGHGIRRISDIKPDMAAAPTNKT